VSVTMRIIAFPEDAPVLLGGKGWIVIEVRGGEFEFAREVEHRDS
jgi:hypothetical protein